MKAVVCVLAFVAAAVCVEVHNHTPPKVTVYSRDPGEYGQRNTMICKVTGFYPPDITIKLLKNGKEIDSAHQTDLAFNVDWHFHLTKNVAFTPKSGETYSCQVTHGSEVSNYIWESNM